MPITSHIKPEYNLIILIHTGMTPDDAFLAIYKRLFQDDAFDPISIQGKLLVIEIFSMYCPHCQREAPAVNRLFNAIRASSAFGDQVKMIDIGVGNSDFEVAHFRKHYQIEFPLFPDEEFVIHKQLGEVRTPFFIIVNLDGKDRGTILWTGTGNLDSLDTFLNRLKQLLGMR